MLAKNIVRINGRKDGRKTHVDLVVVMETVEYISAGKQYSFECPRVPHFDDIPWIGFSKGLESVSSYNYFNWAMNERTTEKC